MAEAPVFAEIMDELEKVVQAKTVFGEPVHVGELTLIPVIDISVGFGGGTGQAPGHDGEKRAPSGEGGGGGAHVSVKAVISIHDGMPTVLPVGRGVAIEHLLEALPELMQRRRGSKAEE